MVCGTLSLVLMALLLRRLRLGHHGVLALWVMAAAPLFLRYAAYMRPYALPVTNGAQEGPDRMAQSPAGIPGSSSGPVPQQRAIRRDRQLAGLANDEILIDFTGGITRERHQARFVKFRIADQQRPLMMDVVAQ